MFLVYLYESLNKYLEDNPAAGNSDAELLMATAASRSLVLWYSEQERAARYLTAAEAASIAEHGWNYLRLVEALARQATRDCILRWKLLPKHHEHQQHHEHRFV